MEVTFINHGVDYMIQSIMHFQTEGEAEFWSEPLYYFYPQLDRTFAASLPVAERRDYIEHCYDTFYLNSAKGAIGDGIHEIIHFIWFYVWNQLFGDNYDEYERPSLKWILSEMVVESVMRDERLSSINPYFPRENGGCVYPYFFDMMVDGKPILDTLDAMYKSQNIEDFMRNSYAYCQEHEAVIREHILKSEG